MKLRFSRSSLNLIIFTCIILIGWASIHKNQTLDDSFAPASRLYSAIELPPLEPLYQQSWTSQEGVDIRWQSRLDHDFLVRIRGMRTDSMSAISNPNISWQAGYWQWDINLGPDFEAGLAELNAQLEEFPQALKGQGGVIILQGPWSASVARLTSARIIKVLRLIAVSDITEETKHDCPWQPISAQFWLQDQLTQATFSQPNMVKKTWQIQQLPKLSTISPASLNVWKQTFVKQWQLNWQNPTTQFDMLADLAYYRLPENYLLQGYWGINALDTQTLEEYLAQCQASSR